MKTFTKLALATAVAVASGGAMAEPFYICDPDPANTGGWNNDGCTGSFEQHGANVGATSHYWDANGDGGISGDSGYDPTDPTAPLNGDGDYAVDEGFGTASTLIYGAAAGALEGTDGAGTALAGFSNVDWRLDFEYDNVVSYIAFVDDSDALDGVTGSGPNDGDGIGELGETIQAGGAFLGGDIRFYYDTTNGVLNDEEFLFTLHVTSGTASAANVELVGTVDFSGSEADDFTGTGTTIGRFAQSAFQNMFWSGGIGDGGAVSTGTGNINWYDQWEANLTDPLNNAPVVWRFDTNIDPADVEAGSAPTNPNFALYDDFTRSSTLNGSVTYKVMAPTPLLLIGSGLFLVGLRNRKAKVRKA